jgi:hypothetical protein
MADQFQSNPYASFDPSQYLNPYSRYNKQALPWPTQYVGLPTDALGRQIGSTPGVTLNQNPVAAAQPAQTQQPDMMAMRNAALTGQPGAALAYGANFAPQGSPPGIQQMYGQNFAAFTPQRNWQGNAAPAQQAPAQQPQALSADDYLSRLANPGKVVTPGAQTAGTSGGGSGANTQPGPGVLQAFLQDWKPAQAGPGSGFQQNFYNTLRGMGY